MPEPRTPNCRSAKGPNRERPGFRYFDTKGRLVAWSIHEAGPALTKALSRQILPA